MKRRMKKRLISAVLSMVMLLVSTPVSATASGRVTPEVSIAELNVDGGKVTVKATISNGLGDYDGTMTVKVEERGTVKLIKNVQMNSGTSIQCSWEDLYNGVYKVEAVYNGDRNHTKGISQEVEFTISGQNEIITGGGSNSGSGDDSGSNDNGSSGGGGNGGGGNSGQTPAIPNANSGNSDSIEWGVITLHPVKGYVSSNYGIMARDNQDKHSKWKLDEISALIWGGNKDSYWQLQYPNGSVAKGSKSVDQNGNPVENYHWEQVNGKWWIFDSNGYAKMGWVYDPNYQSWFYIDMKKGMRTGWIQVNNQWYYLHEASDARMGCMYAATRTPDGYYVKEDGAWDGAARQ